VKDYRNTNLSLGLRNNNPGNLRALPNGQTWKGQSGVNKGFVQFENLELGIRALLIDLSNKYKRGLNTISKIISVYAPPSENDTSNYIATVSKITGLGANEIISDFSNKLNQLALAIIYVENGGNVAKYVTPDDIINAKALINLKNTATAIGKGLILSWLLVGAGLILFIYGSKK